MTRASRLNLSGFANDRRGCICGTKRRLTEVQVSKRNERHKFMRELYEHNAMGWRKERKFYGRGVAANAKYKHSRNMKF